MQVVGLLGNAQAHCLQLQSKEACLLPALKRNTSAGGREQQPDDCAAQVALMAWQWFL